MKNLILLIAFALASFSAVSANSFSQSEEDLPPQSPRQQKLLEKGWKFLNSDAEGACEVLFDDSSWESVTVPHDWAIKGPFDRSIDLQKVAVTQNFEKVETWKTGRSGGLPYIGTGWYRCIFDVPAGKRAILIFDGAMSEAKVFVNGRQVCFWPYGYNAFHCDVTDVLNEDRKGNVLAVRLENKPQSTRWYPGAGLYRNVHLLTVDPIHIPVWGTFVTTPSVSREYASVRLETSVEGLAQGCKVKLLTRIFSPEGDCVSERCTESVGSSFVQNFLVENPSLWSPETPALYRAVTEVCVGDELKDRYETRFGIRSIEFIPEKGFFLNGRCRKFKGVCNHHDLGPLGAAVNVAALRHQLELLKDMGCDAIRTSHNMPAPELVRLCDEMGFMMMIEPFDEWDKAKCRNGYHRFFNETAPDGVKWAEKDMVNMIRHFRNNPCVVLWSIGNEVPTQCEPLGVEVATYLQHICHREDPTRKVTCGMDRVDCVLENGFAAAIDVPGLNYRTFRYLESYERLPQGFILGSETASAVSSRGVYKLPAQKRFSHKYPDHQCSSFDLEACAWSNIPDVDFALADDYEWTLGQFVWTGFDYLGEPSPYDTDSWPNHSSMFGIIDLASIPKDRYYLYRSVWNTASETLHVLPHWNWKKGDLVPVTVYTNYPSAELFVNGVSHGVRHKSASGWTADGEYVGLTRGVQDEPVEGRYRLMWPEVAYQPGEICVIAYDSEGNAVGKTVVRTSGKPHHLELSADRNVLSADGRDLAYVTVKVVDKDGNVCPLDGSEVLFTVSGEGSFRAAANGDPTCLDLFHTGRMHAFNGMLTAIVQSSEIPGELVLTAKGKGLGTATLTICTH